MKKILLAFLAMTVFVISAYAQSDPTQKVDPSILEVMRTFPEEYQEITVVLSDRVAVGALCKKLRKEGLSQDQIALKVQIALAAKASSTQAKLITLMTKDKDIKAGSVRPLWVVNAILARANSDAISRYSEQSEVEWIAPSWKFEPAGAEKISSAIAMPDGHEIGLQVINAPAMWALGYTGYGTKAYIFDTGVDEDHPAVRGHFRYHNDPMSASWRGVDPLPYNCGDHGTHVTGTVMGLDRMTNDTIGVAPNATWIASAQFSTCGSRQVNGLEAMQWALNPDDDLTTVDDAADVMNMSGGSPNPGPESCDEMVARDLLDAMEALGMATAYAAGNEGPSPVTLRSPAHYNFDLVKTFSVGNIVGTDPDLRLNEGSSRGPTICIDPDSSLLIKPEVSAPGTQVRSSVSGGNYSSFTGTSMASPHVAGALLLLREAFPDLLSTELMKALYFSAIDLGDPGEDNDYGMGLIDVFAAFQYLLDLGHQPSPPLPADRDVVMYDLELAKNVFCLGDIEPVITFENAGIDTLHSLEVIRFETNMLFPADTVRWTGKLGPDDLEVFRMPVIGDLAGGEYELNILLRQPNDTIDPRNLNNRFKKTFVVVDLPPVSGELSQDFTQPVCRGSRVWLTSDQVLGPNQEIRWFPTPERGNPLWTGKSYLSNPLDRNTDFYVDLITTYQLGPVDQSFGTVSFSDPNEAMGLRFRALKEFTLESVKVYAGETGGRLVRIIDSEGRSILQRPVRIEETGEQRIELNILIEEGEDYEMLVVAGKPFSFNAEGANFPYIKEGLAMITGGTSDLLPDAYFYFYDWEISTSHGCGRTHIPVEVNRDQRMATVEIFSDRDTAYLSQGAVFVFSDTLEGVTERMWDFGNGTGSSEEQPSVEYLVPGTYLVRLQVMTDSSCQSVGEKQVVVSEELTPTKETGSITGELELYPNPSGGLVYLMLHEEFVASGAELRIFDLLGRTHFHQSLFNATTGYLSLDISHLNSGLYNVHLFSKDGNVLAGRLIKK